MEIIKRKNGIKAELYCADCLEKMKDIPDHSVNLVLVDLPYNLTACEWDKEVLPLDKLWAEWKRICKKNGQVVLFGVEPFSSKVRMSNIKRYRYDWIWKKRTAAGFLSAKKAPLKDYENIMVFYTSDLMNDTTNFFHSVKTYLIQERDKARAAGYRMKDVLGNFMYNHYFTMKTQFAFPKREDYEKLQTTGFFKREYDELKREYDEQKNHVIYNPQFTQGKPYKAELVGWGCAQYGMNEKHILYGSPDGKRYPKQILECGYDKKRGYHPTQKPVKLLEYLIKTYTNEGMTVLDCCMGSGSTGVACMNTNRNFIGIEKLEEYYDTSIMRIAEAAEGASDE